MKIIMTPLAADASRPMVFICAGDPSAENHAARVASLIKKGGLAVSSAGGEKLKNLSDIFVGDTISLETFGFAVSPRAALGILKVYRAVKRHLDERRPSAVLLVDFFGFNAKVGAAAARRGIPVYYYIPPQIWATRYGRIKAIKSFVKKVFTTLPFESEIYAREGIPFEQVGHPLLETTPSGVESRRAGMPPLVGFFPGSRTHVARRHVDIINAVAANLNDIRGAGKTDFALFGLSAIKDSYRRLAKGINLILDAGPRGVAAAEPSAAVSVSGTIATELALMKIPTAIFYKVSALNAFILRAMVKIRTKYVSLPNILLDEELQPEFLQEKALGGDIAVRVAGFLDGEPRDTAEKFARVRRLLEPADASVRVASSIVNDILGASSVGRSNQ